MIHPLFLSERHDDIAEFIYLGMHPGWDHDGGIQLFHDGGPSISVFAEIFDR